MTEIRSVDRWKVILYGGWIREDENDFGRNRRKIGMY